MVLQLYDTYTRSLRNFTPLDPPHVGLYTCGPTVYNYAHIGNLRTYIFEDLLRRVLEFNGYTVRVERFISQINNDLNMPQALALTWELVKRDLPASTKKATLAKFDEVLGLRLAEWIPAEEVVPHEISVLAQQRQQARAEKRWQEADALREEIIAAGYEVADTPQGPHLRLKNSKKR